MTFSIQKSMEQLITWLEGALPGLIGALLILAIGWWISNLLVKLVRRGMTRGHADTGMISFLCSLLKTALYIIIVIMAAAQCGMKVDSLVATLAAAGVTVGLALKDNMANIAGGVQIIFTKPFHGGDYIALQGVEGTVERIEIMFTTLRTFDNKEVVIPNSKITDSIVTNYSAMATRRLDLNYLVGYGEDLAAVKRVLAELAGENPVALKEPAPEVAVGEYRENGILVGVRIWCKTEDYWTLYAEMQENVKNAFEKAGVAVPYRQVDVHMDSAG